MYGRIVCSDMATSETPDIRGVLRAELIRDLALGELTHDQLAEKYDRVTQAISNFASRNKDEIRRAKQAQSDEYQSLGFAEKGERIALRERLIAEIVERLESGELSDSQWKGYGNLVDKLARSIAEERGELYQKSQVEVSGNPFAGFDEIDIGDDGKLRGVK
jgi:hypothetical protein